MRNQVTFYLNGQLTQVEPEHALTMLADYLREIRRLTGTKIVCAEGDCGACTVLRYFPLSAEPRARLVPINSCITPLLQLDGSVIVTIEGVTALSEVQQQMISCHGSQCGFCTPGFVMALSGLVEQKLCQRKSQKKITLQEAKNALTGNLCRCTGYQPILEAASLVDLKKCDSLFEKFCSPQVQKHLRQLLKDPLQIRTPEFTFSAPTQLKSAIAFLKSNPKSQVGAGFTDLGVLQNKRKEQPRSLLSLQALPELYTIKTRKSGRIQVGARVTLAELRRSLKKSVPEFSRALDLFASPQIKNIATLVGNIANASPIGDTPPFLLVAQAVLNVIGPRGKRELKIADFYRGYRKTSLLKSEMILSVTFDIPTPQEELRIYKVSTRKDLDISTVSAAIRAKRNSSGTLASISIALGGVAATPIRLPKTEKFLIQMKFGSYSPSTLHDILQGEIEPLSDLRGSSAMRRVLVENILDRFLDPPAKGARS